MASAPILVRLWMLLSTSSSMMPSEELTHLPSIASSAERRAVETSDVIFSEHEGLAPSQDREMRIMARLHELGTKGQSLVSELAMMRRSGQMDPARYMYIKQALLQYKDEQIQLARQLGDDDLEREYRQQKDGVMESFRMIENGY